MRTTHLKNSPDYMNNAQKLDMGNLVGGKRDAMDEDTAQESKAAHPEPPQKISNTPKEKKPPRRPSRRRARSKAQPQETPPKRQRPLPEEEKKTMEEEALRLEAMRQADREIIETKVPDQDPQDQGARVPTEDIAHPDHDKAQQLRDHAAIQTPLDQKPPISDAEKLRIQEPLQNLHPSMPVESDASRHHSKQTKPGELQQTKRKEDAASKTKKPNRTKITTNTEDKKAVKHINAADAVEEADQRPENSLLPAENDQIRKSKVDEVGTRQQAVITDHPENNVVSKEHFDALMRNVNTMHQELRLELSKLSKQQHEMMLYSEQETQKVAQPPAEYPLLRREQQGHVRFQNRAYVPKQLRMQARRMF